MFRRNTADGDAGGLHLYRSGSNYFINCEFSNNSAGLRGGGIFFGIGVHDCYLLNPLVIDNQCGDTGGGIHAEDPALTNCGYTILGATIAFNKASNAGSGFYSDYTNTPNTTNPFRPLRLLANSILYDNPPSSAGDNIALEATPAGMPNHELDVSNSFIGESLNNQGTLTFASFGAGKPHVDASTLGVIPGWLKPTTRDLRLRSDSYCINRGSDLLVETFGAIGDWMDVDGDFDYLLSPTGYALDRRASPREFFMGDEAATSGSVSTREVFVQGSGAGAWWLLGEAGGNVPGTAICDIGAFEYRIHSILP